MKYKILPLFFFYFNLSSRWIPFGSIDSEKIEENEYDDSKGSKKIEQLNIAIFDSDKVSKSVPVIIKFNKKTESIQQKLSSIMKSEGGMTAEKQQKIFQLIQPFIQSQQNCQSKIDTLLKSNLKILAVKMDLHLVFDRQTIAYVNPQFICLDDSMIDNLNKSLEDADLSLEEIDWDELQMIVSC